MIGLILTIIFIYFMYYIWIVVNYDKYGKLRNNKIKKKKIPAEFEIFVVKNNVDLSKLNYRYFLQLMSLVISIDLGIAITISSFVNNIWLSILVGFLSIIVLVFISYLLLGKYFKKKGLVNNE